jgi:hypothetical protein
MDAWQRWADPSVRWLGDLNRPVQDLASRTADEILRLHSPPWIAGQVFVITHFEKDKAAYEAIEDECNHLNDDKQLTPKLVARVPMTVQELR